MVEVAGVLPVDRVVGAFVDRLVAEVDSVLPVDRAAGAGCALRANLGLGSIADISAPLLRMTFSPRSPRSV